MSPEYLKCALKISNWRMGKGVSVVIFFVDENEEEIRTLSVSKTIPDDVDPQKAILLYHIILSHHGKRDWGSPVEYRCKEAYLIHQADMISSRTNHTNSLKIEKNNWTEEDKLEHKRWFIHE